MSHVRFPTHIATLVLLSALLPASALADIIGPGPRPQRPTPPPRPPVEGGYEVMMKLRAAGYECATVDEMRKETQPSDAAATKDTQGLAPYTVTCRDGKQYKVLLPADAQDARIVVTPLN